MILTAPDKFKSTFSSEAIAEMITDALLRHKAGIAVKSLPLADGGEGSGKILAKAYHANPVKINVLDPLGRPIDTVYYYSDEKQTAIIEGAKAFGLDLLKESERNPLRTNSEGVGQLIAAALRKGAKTIIICLGGSAVNDAGAGLAYALGVRFYDTQNKELIPQGINIGQIAKVNFNNVPQALKHTKIIVPVDVENPLCGPLGASQFFSPQKGADKQAVIRLENAVCKFALLLNSYLPGIAKLPHGGAAGGTAAGLAAFFGADLHKGAEFIMSVTDFEKYSSNAKLIITGEGQTDAGSFKGKLPGAIYDKGAAKGIPVIFISGTNKIEKDLEFKNLKIYSLFSRPPSQKEAIRLTRKRIDFVVQNILSDYARLLSK